MGPELAGIVVLAGIVAFLASVLGGFVAWGWMVVAGLKLRKRMQTDFPERWESLYVWDGIKMTGSNTLFGLKGATPAHWRWIWKKDPAEPEDIRVLKARVRHGVTAFLACFAAGAVAFVVLVWAGRFLPAE